MQPPREFYHAGVFGTPARLTENIPIFFPQQRLLYLARAADGQRFQENDFVGNPPLRHALGKVHEYLLGLQTAPWLADDEQQGSLLPFGMFDADDSRCRDGRIGSSLSLRRPETNP